MLQMPQNKASHRARLSKLMFKTVVPSVKVPETCFYSISFSAESSCGTKVLQFFVRDKGWVQSSKVKLAVCLGLAMSALRLVAHPELDAQIHALTAQLKEQPANAELYLSRADVRRQHGESDLALADIATAARLKPGWSKPLLVRAKTLFDANRIQEAQTTVEEFLRLEPNHATALVLGGRCKLKLGKLEQAITDYSAALQAFAQPNPDLYVERAQLQASMGKFDEAVRGLDEGVARLAGIPTLQLVAIEYERQQGHFNAALERTDKLLRGVRQPDTLLLRAQLLEHTGRLDEAKRAFQSVLDFISGTAGIRRTESLSATLKLATQGLARVEAKLSRPALQGVLNATPKIPN